MTEDFAYMSLDHANHVNPNENTTRNIEARSIGAQTFIETRSIGTQTDSFNSSQRFRILSIIIYILMRMHEISFANCRFILASLNLLSISKCHGWVSTIIDENDVSVILRDRRGEFKYITFYDNFPGLELDAKAYAMTKAMFFLNTRNK